MRRAKSEWCRSLSGMSDRAVHLRAVPRPPQVLWPQVRANEDGLVPPQLGRAAASAAVDLQTAAWALGYTAIRRHDASTPPLRDGTARGGTEPNFQ
jgi:hypothetical protein